MPLTTQGKIERLPKWAQSHIQVLEANLKCAKNKLAEVLGEGASYDRKSLPVDLSPYHEVVPLPSGSTVRFHLGARDTQVYIDVRSLEDSQGPAIQLMARNVLFVEGRATNMMLARSRLR